MEDFFSFDIEDDLTFYCAKHSNGGISFKMLDKNTYTIYNSYKTIKKNKFNITNQILFELIKNDAFDDELYMDKYIFYRHFTKIDNIPTAIIIVEQPEYYGFYKIVFKFNKE